MIFPVIFPKESRSLGETHALHEEYLKENDMLLFVRRRSANAPDSDRDLDLKAPTSADIFAATKELPVPLPPVPKNRDQSSSNGGRIVGVGRNHHVTIEDSTSADASVDVSKINMTIALIDYSFKR